MPFGSDTFTLNYPLPTDAARRADEPPSRPGISGLVTGVAATTIGRVVDSGTGQARRLHADHAAVPNNVSACTDARDRSADRHPAIASSRRYPVTPRFGSNSLL